MPGLSVHFHLAGIAGAAALVIAAAGCNGDEPTPDCFERDAAGNCVTPEPDGPPGPLALSCGDLPETAVRATFDHQLDLSGGTGDYAVTVSGLPAGLSADAAGAISGVPTEAGTFTLMVAATDRGNGDSDDVSCDLVVNEALRFDPADQPRACLDVADFGDIRGGLVGGTGEDIRCTLPGDGGGSTTCPLREGNGVMPAGVSFDDASCTVSGTVTEDAYGTWVFMVEAEQSGATVYVPLCASREDPAAAHVVSVDFDGDTDPLRPAVLGPSAADEVVAIGGAAPGPAFAVRGANCAGGACDNYAFNFSVTCSPFCATGEAQPGGGSCAGGFSLAPDAILEEGGANTGFTHALSASTEIPIGEWSRDDPAGDWTQRPWVASWSISYCTGDTPCDASVDPQTTYNYAVLAFPR